MVDSDKGGGTFGPGPGQPIRDVPVDWEALEDAFENNAPEVHSYLQLDTGEVIRIVDGIADPQMHSRVMNDQAYLRVEPVSSREQYRWMERFIATVEESEFRDKLVQAIDGKGAFRRFKDVLMSYPVDRERWFAFRSERLRSCMEAWLTAHAIAAVPRQQWRVPTADEVRPTVEEAAAVEKPARRNRAAIAEAHRRRLHELIDQLPARELDAAVAFLDFLRERKHLPRPRAKGESESEGAEPGGGHESGETSLDHEPSGETQLDPAAAAKSP
jgi:hypothetical protein